MKKQIANVKKKKRKKKIFKMGYSHKFICGSLQHIILVFLELCAPLPHSSSLSPTLSLSLTHKHIISFPHINFK